jgi:hypothetical protein
MQKYPSTLRLVYIHYRDYFPLLSGHCISTHHLNLPVPDVDLTVLAVDLAKKKFVDVLRNYWRFLKRV